MVQQTKVAPDLLGTFRQDLLRPLRRSTCDLDAWSHLEPPHASNLTVDPATAAAAAAADPNASADVIMASVSAHTQIAQTVAAMPQAHLQLCLGTMQELAKAAPERARATLLEHPQLCYALLHAQFLLGLSLEPVLPPDGVETQQLRAEAVQRAMVNTKALGRRGQGMKGGGPPHVAQRQAASPGLVPPPPRPNGGYAKASGLPAGDGLQALRKTK
eukprot:symbB.v1.2.020624.t1/scaffold1747.1/size103332/11